GAANAGIRAAHGAIVEYLNDDTEVTPGWAELALAGFDDPQVAAVAPLVLRPGQWGRHSCLPRPRQTGMSAPPAPLEIDSAGDRYYLGGVAGKRGHGQALGATYLQ